MKTHLVTIEGDFNDADYVGASCLVSLDSPFFENYIEPYNEFCFTYREFFTAFSQALSQNKSFSNWSEDSREEVLKETIKKLNLEDKDLSTDLFYENLFDFLPSAGDRDIHTILSIVATPAQDTITFL